MDLDTEEVADILDTLNRGKEKLRKLREERDRLHEENKRLRREANISNIKGENEEERIQKVVEERDELLEADRELVELVETLEESLEEIGGWDPEEDFETEGGEYSYGEGWRPRESRVKKSLELDSDVDMEEIERQMDAIRDHIERIQKYKSE